MMLGKQRVTLASMWAFEDVGVQEVTDAIKKSNPHIDLECHYHSSDNVLEVAGNLEGCPSQIANTVSGFIDSQRNKDLLDMPRINQLDHSPKIQDDEKPGSDQGDDGGLLALGDTSDEDLVPNPVVVTKFWVSPTGGAGCFSENRFHEFVAQVADLTGTAITLVEECKVQVTGKSSEDVEDALVKLSRIERPLSFIVSPHVANINATPGDDRIRLRLQGYSSLNCVALGRILADPSSTLSSDFGQMFVTVLLSFDEEAQSFKAPKNLLNPPHVTEGPGRSRIWNGFTFQGIGKGDEYIAMDKSDERATGKSQPIASSLSAPHPYLTAEKAKQVNQWVVEGVEPEQTISAPEAESKPLPQLDSAPTQTPDLAPPPKRPPGIKGRRPMPSDKDQPMTTREREEAKSEPEMTQAPAPKDKTPERAIAQAPEIEEDAPKPRRKWRMIYNAEASTTGQQAADPVAEAPASQSLSSPLKGAPNSSHPMVSEEKACLPPTFDTSKYRLNSSVPQTTKGTWGNSQGWRTNPKPVWTPEKKHSKRKALVEVLEPRTTGSTSTHHVLSFHRPALVPTNPISNSIEVSPHPTDDSVVHGISNNSLDLAGLTFEDPIIPLELSSSVSVRGATSSSNDRASFPGDGGDTSPGNDKVASSGDGSDSSPSSDRELSSENDRVVASDNGKETSLSNGRTAFPSNDRVIALHNNRNMSSGNAGAMSTSSASIPEQTERLASLSKVFKESDDDGRPLVVAGAYSTAPGLRQTQGTLARDKAMALERAHRTDRRSGNEVVTRNFHRTMAQKAPRPSNQVQSKAVNKAKKQATLEDAWGWGIHKKKPEKKQPAEASGTQPCPDPKEDKQATPMGQVQTKQKSQIGKGLDNVMNNRLDEDIKNLYEAFRPTLEAAESFPGSMSLEVQIGLLLMPTIPQICSERLISPNEWVKIFQPRNGLAAPTTKFISRLTTSGADVDHLVNLKTSKAEGKRPLFEQEYDEYNVSYEYHCRTKTGQLLVIVIDEQGNHTVRHPISPLGSVNLHFPGQIWDAMVAINCITEHQPGASPEFEEAAQHMVDHLWIPEDRPLLCIFTQFSDGNKVTVEKVFLKRWTRHRFIRSNEASLDSIHCPNKSTSDVRSPAKAVQGANASASARLDETNHKVQGSSTSENQTNEDLYLQILEVQDLVIGTTSDEQAVRARALQPHEMIRRGRLWYEASLMSPAIESILKSNTNLEIGERTDDWCRVDLFGRDAAIIGDKQKSLASDTPTGPVATAIGCGGLGDLLRLARVVVGKADGIGYWNEGPGAVVAEGALVAQPAPASKGLDFDELESVKEIGSAGPHNDMTGLVALGQLESEFW
ncbi:hypothetical protein BO94DRAFT_539628 [Aspergillus sclerotioniger CBS 115572]|uniref:Uncharacterized protein n=1 Tax=Aspergillus sclerotioniger CBS 115572 TaxID=1450535 RepID=A0A317VCE4_9EURO|nr:hypothetical protein BO94DRAFT_539628 [Aspergillus sclerotioniger CBS 115572]PWY71089.1 hypothetical protein BO94DRAFT_539628 [Aspergillus sclerotioniger CBS 115572]